MGDILIKQYFYIQVLKNGQEPCYLNRRLLVFPMGLWFKSTHPQLLNYQRKVLMNDYYVKTSPIISWGWGVGEGGDQN